LFVEGDFETMGRTQRLFDAREWLADINILSVPAARPALS